MIYTFHWHSIVNSHGSLNKHKGIGGIYNFEFDDWLRQRNIPEDDKSFISGCCLNYSKTNVSGLTSDFFLFIFTLIQYSLMLTEYVLSTSKHHAKNRLDLTQGCSILLMFQVNRNNCNLKKKLN